MNVHRLSAGNTFEKISTIPVTMVPVSASFLCGSVVSYMDLFACLSLKDRVYFTSKIGKTLCNFREVIADTLLKNITTRTSNGLYCPENMERRIFKTFINIINSYLSFNFQYHFQFQCNISKSQSNITIFHCDITNSKVIYSRSIQI